MTEAKAPAPPKVIQAAATMPEKRVLFKDVDGMHPLAFASPFINHDALHNGKECKISPTIFPHITPLYLPPEDKMTFNPCIFLQFNY
jgi:hypothetical protein